MSSYYDKSNFKGIDYNNNPQINTNHFKIPQNSQNEFFTLGEENPQNSNYNSNTMNLINPNRKSSISDSDHFSPKVKTQRKTFGNEDPRLKKLLEITANQHVRKMGTTFTQIHAISEKIGYICTRSNIYEFYWHNRYNVIKPKFLLQGNFTDILGIDHIYDKPVFLAKKDENVKFCKLGKSKKLEIFAKIPYNPFDHESYKMALHPSRDKRYLFAKEKENKILLFNFSERTHHNELTAIGLTVYEQGLRIHSFFYDYKNKLLFVFFTNCQYSVEHVLSSSDRSRKQNLAKQTKVENSLVGSPSKRKAKIMTEMRPDDLSGFDSKVFELKGAKMCSDRRTFFVCGFDTRDKKTYIAYYKRNGPSLSLYGKIYIRDLEGKKLKSILLNIY